ncbi:MAG: ATP-dependent RNA helicase HrpA, partial [Syntrophales bacterium]
EEKGDFTHVEAAVRAVDELMQENVGGDILIFMPTEQDIRESCEHLTERSHENTIILPMYARLSWKEQRLVFQRMPQQKIIVATNIAETSLTIPGIRYVIDSGLTRLSQYNPRTRTNSLPIRPISQSSAEQRKGRCGRVEHGICIRLYDEVDFMNRPLHTVPEILRANLAEVILRMIALKLGDILTFPFIDTPRPRHIRDGIEVLVELGAITEYADADSLTYRLTEKGQIMSRLPLDPRISRIIIAGEEEDCLDEIFILAAALSIQDPRERPADSESEADRIHRSWQEPTSDFLTLLKIWNQYHSFLKGNPSHNRMRKFCRDHFLSYRRMREWRDIHDQIRSIYTEECPRRTHLQTSGKVSERKKISMPGRVHRAVLSGFLSNVAMKKEKNVYTGAKGKEAMIFPASGLWNHGGPWIVAAEIVETSKRFARTAANIDPVWIEEIGSHLCSRSYMEPHWDNKRGQVVALEKITLYDLAVVESRPVPYGPIDPDDASRIFAMALASSDVTKHIPFLGHNQKLIEHIENIESKIRRRNLLIEETDIAHFYEERLPGIYDLKTLQGIIRDTGNDDFLRMTEADLLRMSPDNEIEKLFPDEVFAGPLRFPLSYRFMPGTEGDGITMMIPWGVLSEIPAPAMDWTIPGLLQEKVLALLKGLPKAYRKKLHPIQDMYEAFEQETSDKSKPLITALSSFIHNRYNVEIPFSAWPFEHLPDHLKIRYVITDETGRELISGRDFRHLQDTIHHDEESSAFEKIRPQWERDEIFRWDFGDLPEYVILGSASHPTGLAYPALAVIDGKVALRLFRNQKEAASSHLMGVAGLYSLHFRDEMKYLLKSLSLRTYMKDTVSCFGGHKAIEGILMDKVKHDLFAMPVRTTASFAEHAASVASRILPHGQDVLKAARPLFEACQQVKEVIAGLSKSQRRDSLAVSFLKDMEDEFAQLMPMDFLQRYPAERYSWLLRYLKALIIRTERGIQHVGKSQLRSKEIAVFRIRYLELLASAVLLCSPEKRKAMDELFWMIEEYKVSLFAQELKTAVPVSRKRLEDKISCIELME